MASGVYQTTKKDGTAYYRASITYRAKHISLGSYSTSEQAHLAYSQSRNLLQDTSITIDNVQFADYTLPFEKIIVLLNFRDHLIYIKNPIYLERSYFNYYLTPSEVYKFDTDDLFYFSEHKLMRRGGHLYVNDYGMQVTILSRFGIRSFAVAGRDYKFANQDPYDLRYENIININPYYGVRQDNQNGMLKYHSYIHISGEYHIGCYDTLHEAAIAYNKAVDLAHQHGIQKNFPMNYIAELSASSYARQYVQTKLSQKYCTYLKSLSSQNE